MKNQEIGQSPRYLSYLSFFITMSMAQACLGGIGKSPPHPSRLRQTLLLRRLRLRRSEVPQPLRIWRRFSNTSSTCLGHCLILNFSYSYVNHRMHISKRLWGLGHFWPLNRHFSSHLHLNIQGGLFDSAFLLILLRLHYEAICFYQLVQK